MTTYKSRVCKALTSLNDRKGSSLNAIKKILWGVASGTDSECRYLNKAVRSLVSQGTVIKKGGRYTLVTKRKPSKQNKKAKAKAKAKSNKPEPKAPKSVGCCKISDCTGPAFLGNYGFCVDHRNESTLRENTHKRKSSKREASSNAHLSAYEIARCQQIKENEAELARLGLGNFKIGKKKKKKRSVYVGTCKECEAPAAPGNFGFCVEHRQKKAKQVPRKGEQQVPRLEGERKSIRNLGKVAVKYNDYEDSGGSGSEGEEDNH